MSRWLERLWLLTVLALVACSSQPTPPSVTYHQDVAPLVQEKCAGCHVEGGIAPFSLESYSQVFEHRQEIRDAVQSRIMPPWPPDPGCAEYTRDLSLSEEQTSLLTRWVDANGPEGEPTESIAMPQTPAGGLSRVDVELTMPVEYTPQKVPDDYRCFILDWPQGQARFITGFNGKPGQRGEIHHMIAYLIRPEEVAAVQALDDAEPGPGYTCFGGPGGDNSAPTWLGAWAPGGQGADYPERTGLEIAPGSKVVLQVHYNTSYEAPSPDRTSIQFKLDAHVDTPAYVLLWADPSWVQDHTMDIPAGQPDVVHSWTYDPTSLLQLVTRGAVPSGVPIALHSAALHMHTRGTHGRLSVSRDVNETACLLDIPRWDFHWQNQYMFQQPKVVRPGDLLTVECHWDNSAPGAVDTNWGDGTSDEMCLGIFYMTPLPATPP